MGSGNPETDAEIFQSGARNDYDSFNILTCIRKLGDRWFLVDCYHDQILYSDDPKTPVQEWQVMTRAITRGHTIDFDGEFYLADDTNNNRVLVFRERDGQFELAGQFSDIGILPHFVVYDKRTERFYVLSSMTGELYVFTNTRILGDISVSAETEAGTQISDKKAHEIVLERIFYIEELNESYVRSFTIDGENVYFVSGNGNVILAKLPEPSENGAFESLPDRTELEILERYPVSDDIAGMVQLERIGDYFYITVSTNADFDQDYATILRTKDLNSLRDYHKTTSVSMTNDGESPVCEDIYSLFIGGGTPYYIGSADSHFYLTEHRLPGHALWQFDVLDDEITDFEAIQ
ncbi:MAG: hypothetical protein IJ873_06560 [Lachnospiraceae bacterium]|nr:hypothetical protein [Lachnospiraceae bacterium]